MLLGDLDSYKLFDEDASTTTGRSTSSASSIRHKGGLDIMVSRFTSHDPTVGTAVARNCKEKRWKVTFNPDADPIDILLHVHSHKLNASAVSIESNGQAVLHGAGPNRKAEMTEDLCYEWPIHETSDRSNVISIDDVGAHPKRLCTEAPMDSQYSIRSSIRSNNSSLVAVPANHPTMRATSSGHRVSWASLPDISSLKLHVPKQDPSRAVLSMDGETVSFGKPSPPHLDNEDKPKIRLQLSKDRSIVQANVGHSILSHFMSGEVRADTSRLGKLMRSWTVELGPFANHTITVSKNYTFGKIITLVVDGEVFVESNSADLGFNGDGWECHFSFIGERLLDFESFHTDKAGGALNETSHREERRKYVHKCCVAVPKDFNFGTARFFVDGIDFDLLPVMADSRPQLPLAVIPETLQEVYGITVPGREDRRRSTQNDMQRLGTSIMSFFQSNAEPATVVCI